MDRLGKLIIAQEVYKSYKDKIELHLKDGYKKEDLNDFDVFLGNAIAQEELLEQGYLKL